MKKRLQLELDEAATKRLDALKGQGAYVDVVRKAIALYDLAKEHEAEGGKLVFRQADGKEEVLRLV